MSKSGDNRSKYKNNKGVKGGKGAKTTGGRTLTPAQRGQAARAFNRAVGR